jgi:hypothetical protein
LAIATKKINSNIFETALAFVILLAILFWVFDYYEANDSESKFYNPFADYYANPGII